MIEWWKHNFGAGKIRMCPGKKQGRAGSRRNGEQEKQKMERRFKIQSNLRIVNCERPLGRGSLPFSRELRLMAL